MSSKSRDIPRENPNAKPRDGKAGLAASLACKGIMLAGLPVYRTTGILPVGQPGVPPGFAYSQPARCLPAPQPGWLCSFVLHWITHETQAFRLHVLV